MFREYGEVFAASYSEDVIQYMVKLFCSFLAVVFMKLVSQTIVSNILVVLNFFLTL